MMERIDFTSETWVKLRRHIEARIEELRDQLENETDTEITAQTRGRIAELRLLIATVHPSREDHGSPETATGSLY